MENLKILISKIAKGEISLLTNDIIIQSVISDRDISNSNADFFIEGEAAITLLKVINHCNDINSVEVLVDLIRLNLISYLGDTHFLLTLGDISDEHITVDQLSILEAIKNNDSIKTIYISTDYHTFPTFFNALMRILKNKENIQNLITDNLDVFNINYSDFILNLRFLEIQSNSYITKLLSEESIANNKPHNKTSNLELKAIFKRTFKSIEGAKNLKTLYLCEEQILSEKNVNHILKYVSKTKIHTLILQNVCLNIDKTSETIEWNAIYQSSLRVLEIRWISISQFSFMNIFGQLSHSGNKNSVDNIFNYCSIRFACVVPPPNSLYLQSKYSETDHNKFEFLKDLQQKEMKEIFDIEGLYEIYKFPAVRLLLKDREYLDIQFNHLIGVGPFFNKEQRKIVDMRLARQTTYGQWDEMRAGIFEANCIRNKASMVKSEFYKICTDDDILKNARKALTNTFDEFASLKEMIYINNLDPETFIALRTAYKQVLVEREIQQYSLSKLIRSLSKKPRLKTKDLTIRPSKEALAAILSYLDINIKDLKVKSENLIKIQNTFDKNSLLSRNYQYTDNDMDNILNLRLQEETIIQSDHLTADDSSFLLMSSIGGVSTQENLHEKYTALILETINRYTNILGLTIAIPYNLRNNHWVGIVFNINNQGQINVHYADSLQGNIDEGISNILNEVALKLSVMDNTTVSDTINYINEEVPYQRFSSDDCGPEAIENIVDILCKQREIPKTAMKFIEKGAQARLHHSELLQRYNQVPQNNTLANNTDNNITRKAQINDTDIFSHNISENHVETYIADKQNYDDNEEISETLSVYWSCEYNSDHSL